MDFRRATLRKAHREVARRDVLRRFRHAPHRVSDGARQLDAEQQDKEHRHAERAQAHEDGPVRLARRRRGARSREIVLRSQHLRHLPPERVEPSAAFRLGDGRARRRRAELGNPDERHGVVLLVLADGLDETPGALLLPFAPGRTRREGRNRRRKVLADGLPRAPEPRVAGVDEATQGGIELQQVLLQHERRGGDVLRAVRRRGRRPQLGERDHEDGERCRDEHGKQRARERDPRDERDAHAEGAKHRQTEYAVEPARVRLLELYVRHWAHSLTRGLARPPSAAGDRTAWRGSGWRLRPPRRLHRSR